MIEENGVERTIAQVAGAIITKLDKLREESSGKAALANLRNSIGRPYSQTMDVWPIIFEQMPEKALGRNIDLTNYEKAILTTLQLYAMHQQGVEKSVNKYYEDHRWNNIGESLSVLRGSEDTRAIDRRFNVMITATTYEELTHHLRQMIRLLRAKQRGETINYGQLANDLFYFLTGNEERIRLRWAKAYYSTRHKVEKGEEKNDK